MNAIDIEHLIPATLRIAEELQRLSRGTAPAGIPPAALGPEPRPVRDAAVERDELAKLIGHHRRIRLRMVASLGSGECAWDVALALYVGEREGGRLDDTALAHQLGEPLAAIRAELDRLVVRGAVVRRPALALAPATRAEITAYLDIVLGYLG